MSSKGWRIVRQDGANCKVNYDISRISLISGAESNSETFVIAPSSPSSVTTVFLSISVSLGSYTRQREPRKIKLRVFVTDVRGRNEWTMRAARARTLYDTLLHENRDKEMHTREFATSDECWLKKRK